MIIYSIVPQEMIFEGQDQFQPSYEEIEVGGVQLIVERNEQNQARIVRLISSDPQQYLNPQYAPGQMITFLPN